MPRVPNLKRKPRSNFYYLIIIALLISALFFAFSPSEEEVEKVSLNTFLTQAQEGQVDEVKVVKNKLEITLVDGTQEYTFKETGADVYDLLEKVEIPPETLSVMKIEIVPTEATDFWIELLIGMVPFLLIIAFFVFMMRQAQSSSNQAMSFGKSKARLYEKGKQKTTFDDVAGCEEAKEELIEVVDFLKNPAKYLTIGAKIPKGVILVGSPGTGKTLLARAVAGEANVPFFSITGSEFVEMFVGVGASRVRDLFKRAKRNAPCIIFIDEIDAVGRHRGAGLGGGHDEREQTLNQILSEMDGFEKGTNVIVIAATNRPDVLDPALLRPGRFDRRIVVDLPDIKDREAILKIHARGKPLQKKADLNKIARSTPGFSGADLENLMNEAAILAARENKKEVGMSDLEESIEKVMLGPERKSRVLSKKEKEITAFHECGHALVAQLLPNCDPVHKVSIVSRGLALGVTWFLPEEDKHLYSKSKFEDEIASLLGGYTAEEITFGEITTGASNDLQRATNIARKMVTEFGMSDLGPIIFGDSHKEIFLGKDFGTMRNYSEEMASKIDAKVREIIDKAHQIAKDLIAKNKALLKKIAEDLIEKETLNEVEFAKYFKDKKIKKTAQARKRKD